jgi:hypothetical protein
VVTYWWAILAALAVAVADCLVWCRVMHRGAAVEQTRREHTALAAPADQQHAWVLGSSPGMTAAPTANTRQSKSRLMLVASRTRGCALQRLFSGLGTCSVNYL